MESCCKSLSPPAFAGIYPIAAFKVIHPGNMEKVILDFPE